MRLSILSLLSITAFVTVLMWGVSQSRYRSNIKSHASIYIPHIEDHQVAFSLISEHDGIVVVGATTKARIVMSHLVGSTTKTLFEEELLPGTHSLWLGPTSNTASHQRFGLMVHGRSHFVSGPLQSSLTNSNDQILSDGASKELLEAFDWESQNRLEFYRVTLELLDHRSPKTDATLASP